MRIYFSLNPQPVYSSGVSFLANFRTKIQIYLGIFL